jgi:hypothetical protein
VKALIDLDDFKKLLFEWLNQATLNDLSKFIVLTSLTAIGEPCNMSSILIPFLLF